MACFLNIVFQKSSMNFPINSIISFLIGTRILVYIYEYSMYYVYIRFPPIPQTKNKLPQLLQCHDNIFMTMKIGPKQGCPKISPGLFEILNYKFHG